VEVLQALVCGKKRLFGASFMLKVVSLYQDRLGTNIGKAETKSGVFSAGWAAQVKGPDHAGGAAGQARVGEAGGQGA
jgi:hypothetical protein